MTPSRFCMRRFVVTRPEMPEDRMTVIVDANGREMAKRIAKDELGGDSDMYIVTPLPAVDPDKPRLVWKDSGEVRR